MAAGLGFKTFTTGEVLKAADTNGYLMQGVLVFASSAARAAAITSPQEGQYSYLKDTNSTEYYDGAAWIAAPIGDITGVTAGTGISGGGTSGTVTVTNDMATTITAAGDIVVGTGSGTYDNLPIGTTAQVLTADTTVSPYKVKWATPASGSTFAGTRLTNTTDFTIATSTNTLLTWNTETYDTDAFHSTATNTSRITIPAGKAGYYLIQSNIMWYYNVNYYRNISIYKNGTSVTGSGTIGDNAGNTYPTVQHSVSAILYLAVADYIEVNVLQTTGGNLNIWGSTSQGLTTMFQAAYLGA